MSDQYIERAEYAWSDDSIRLIVTPGNTAKTTYLYVQEAGYFKTAYPYFTERENLNSYLLIYTVSGRGQLRYGDTDYELEAGSCIYIDCRRYHHYWTKAGETWELLWVHFNGTGAGGYYQEFAKSGFRVIYGIDHHYMNTTLWNMIELHQHKNRTTEVRCDHLLHGLAAELIIRNGTNDSEQFFVPEYIKEIARDIEREFRQPLRLDDFARRYHRSKYHIAKEFKKYIGVTLNEYIIVSRISYAKEMLKYSNHPVCDVAREAGIDNVTHFINLFKQREGVTPLVYRKEWQAG